MPEGPLPAKPATRAVAAAESGRSRLLGAIDFKGWHYVLLFDGVTVAFPRTCACCRGPATLTLEAWQEKAKVVRYPLCERCQLHGRVSDVAALVAAIVGLLAALGVYRYFWGFKIPTGLGLAALTFIIVFLVIASVCYTILRLLAPKKPSCADREWPVIMLPETFPRSSEPEKTEARMDHAFRQLRISIASGVAGVVTLQLSNLAVARDVMTAHGVNPAQMIVLKEKGGQPVVQTTRARLRIDDREFDSLEAARGYLIERYGPVAGARLHARLATATAEARPGRAGQSG